MPTLIRDPQPPEIVALIERRHRLDQDRSDEVWAGVYHMNPAPRGRHHLLVQRLAEVLGPCARDAGLVPAMGEFNLGEPGDYRVPDGAIHRDAQDRVYYRTAPLVVEIVSPGDETWEKLPFYAAHDVAELVIVDPQERRVHWLALRDGRYEALRRSSLIALGPDELGRRIEWP